MLFIPGRTGLVLRLGPFLTRITSNIDRFIAITRSFYHASPAFEDSDRFVDIHVKLLKILPLRRWQMDRVAFVTDHPNPYPTFPAQHHFALFEWGLNWCIATQAHQYVMLHAAVLEKNGRALVLPAFPGSGKSTLCAALTIRGWRLLSDEFGLYRPETHELMPIPRPIALKNTSIEVIREFAPEVELGPVFRGTHKGDVAHVHVPEEDIRRQDETAVPGWIVFPQYRKDVDTRLYEFAKGRAFLKLAGNSFNYKLQGTRGFNAMTQLVRNCATYYFEFDNLEHAYSALERLAEETPAYPAR